MYGSDMGRLLSQSTQQPRFADSCVQVIEFQASPSEGKGIDGSPGATPEEEIFPDGARRSLASIFNRYLGGKILRKEYCHAVEDLLRHR